MNSTHSAPVVQNSVSLDSLTRQQYSLIKSHLVDIANRFNENYPSFIPLYSEFSPGLRIIDNFSDCIVFNTHNKQKDDKFCSQQLDNMVLESSTSPSTTIIALDASIKNNIATSILHTHTHNRPITKTIHHVIYVTSTEAELFVIRCSINQASNIDSISKIVVVTDSIHMARKIFDPSIHPYQVQSAAVLSDLHKFFLHYKNNSIEFWECPSYLNWHLYKAVDKETKAFNPTSLFSCKTLWDFNKKRESDNIINIWKMMLQASDLKEKQFLDLLDNDNNIIELSYIKGGSWLKTFGYSTFLYVHATRAITNHASIGKYRLRFFPEKNLDVHVVYTPSN